MTILKEEKYTTIDATLDAGHGLPAMDHKVAVVDLVHIL
jgi:hypothetical protein